MPNQLEHLSEVLDGRDMIARYLLDELRGTPGIGVPDLPAGSRAAWYGLPLVACRLPLAGQYVAAIREVSAHHKGLLP